MDDPFREFNEIEWQTYETFYVLKAFEQFWCGTERIVSDDAANTERHHGPRAGSSAVDNEIEYREAIRMARHLHDEIITPTFRYASVVTLFAIFERELKRLADNLAKDGRAPISYKDLRGGLLEQLGKFTEGFCGFGIAGCRGYTQICDLQKVRDCIVHCYGDVALSRDSKYLLKLNSTSVGLEIFEGAQMAIGPAFLTASLSAIRSFFHDLFVKLGWKINDRWLKNLP